MSGCRLAERGLRGKVRSRSSSGLTDGLNGLGSGGTLASEDTVQALFQLLVRLEGFGSNDILELVLALQITR